MRPRVFIILLFISLPLWVQGQSDFELVKKRVVEDITRRPPRDERVKRIVETMQDDGSWPGINYEDVSNTGFQHSRHLSNMETMSLAFISPESDYYLDQELNSLVNKALGFWCENDFICDNWWWNQIGTPNSLVTVLLLMDDHIEPGLKNETLRIIGRAHLDAPGARPGGDRIKIGGIAAKRVLVMGDSAMFKDIMKVINDEIKFSTGDRGMQQDYSFHHRIFRVNNTVTYGLGYASEFADWALFVKGTKYAFEDEKTRLLVNYYLDGICKQYIYGIYIDWGVLNRDVSRGHSMRPQNTNILENLIQVTDYRSEELNEIISLRKGDSEPSSSFCKFFWQTEHFVCQRPDFYTSVRMFSVRNRNMEQPYNSEGLKNHHKADGANFLSIRGDEYLGIWPVYDWQKIPGATILQKKELPPPGEIQKDGFTYFVGAVTDGLYGAVGFDFISPHDMVKARKSWFFFDEEYVCLGAGIEADFGPPVATTINQCLLNGNVEVGDKEGVRTLTEGEHVLKDINWVHHDDIGYIFPEPADIHLSNQVESGSWWDITKQWSTSRETVERNVFTLWIDHGSRPQGRRGGFENAPMIPRDVTYQYIVVPSINPGEMKQDRGIEILENTRDVQAVKHRALGLAQVIFYKAGSVKISEGLQLAADSPGAIMLKMKEDTVTSITVADPSRSLGRLHLIISGEIKALSTEIIHVTYDLEYNESHLTVTLPSGPYAGQSVQVNLHN